MSRPAKGVLDQTIEVSVKSFAELIGVTAIYCHNLVKAGTLPKTKEGVFPLQDAVRAYIASVKGERKATTASAKRDALIEEQTRKLKLENDLKEGQLVEIGVVLDLAKTWAGSVQSELANWPARVSRDEAVRAALEKEVSASFERIRRSVERAANELLSASADEADEDVDDDEDEAS